MAGLDHNLVDAVEHFRGEQPQVIPQCLERIRRAILPPAMTKEQPDCLMFVGQFTNPVIVRIEGHAQHAQDEDLPLRHPGSTVVDVRFGDTVLGFPNRNQLLEDRKDFRTRVPISIQMLQAPEDLRNVIS